MHPGTEEGSALVSNICFSYFTLGVDLKKVDKCIGDPEADMENPVLKTEQDAQVKLRKSGFLCEDKFDSFGYSFNLCIFGLMILTSDWKRPSRRCDYTANSCC